MTMFRFCEIEPERVPNNIRYEESRQGVITNNYFLPLIRNEYEAVQEITGGKFAQLYNCNNPSADRSFGFGGIGVVNGQVNSLFLDRFDLKELSPTIKQLTHLRDLNLPYNQLVYLPDEIYGLQELRRLILNNNQLTMISPRIKNLSHLDMFIISNNKLTHLTDEIGELSELMYLDIRGNQLETLPQNLKNLLEKESVYVRQNPYNKQTLNLLKRLEKKKGFTFI